MTYVDVATKLKRKPRNGRTAEQVLNHYLIETEIAQKLKDAPREERSAIYSSMYDELFDKVPDHPRLNIRNNEQLSKKGVRHKLALVAPFLKDKMTFAEFAPGDCRFAMHVAPKVKLIYGIDISEQYQKDEKMPQNFELIIYDGYALKGIPNNSVDIVFSDQLIEHIHPDDVEHHFLLIKKMLIKGGLYIMRTPHKSSGPHDVSVYFSDVPLGFHLKEWSYVELQELTKKLGFKITHTYWFGKGFKCRVPVAYFLNMERVFSMLPHNLSRKVSQYFIPSICCVFQAD